MSGATVLDLVLLLIFVAYAVRMYRVGLVTGALSLVGFLVGGLLGLWLLPRVLSGWLTADGPSLWRGVALIFGVLVIASLGQTLGALAGLRLRSLVRVRPARVVDSVLGALLSIVVTAALAWFVVGAVGGLLPPSASRAVAHSRVLQGIDRAMPIQADRVIAGAQRMLDQQGFPRVFSGVRVEPVRPVDPPDPGVAKGRGVDAAAASIVKVTGVATACSRGQEGSGWVAAPHRVVTNAHVVAGVAHPTVRVRGTGRALRATTVVFDPDRDVAVLAVPDLSARPLPTGGELGHGDAAVVAGFPQDGPYRVSSARVRAVLDAHGADIYGNPGVDRMVYSFRGEVQHGNSGGPLLSPSGQVVGTVFAKSIDHSGTGYALTLDETRDLVRQAAGETEAVPTGSCTH